MRATRKENIENKFDLLPVEEKIAVITHGAALRLSALKNRLFLAESKVHGFQDKYDISLVDLEAKGLPDDADYEMHEDYIMWHHWAEVGEKLRGQITSLSPLVAQGLYVGEGLDVGG